MFAAKRIKLTDLLRLIKETPDFIYEVIKALPWKTLHIHPEGLCHMNMLI